MTTPDLLVAAVAIVLFLVERFTGRKDVGALVATYSAQLSEVVAKADEERKHLLAEFSRERSELLTRVQHPDVIIAPPAPGVEAAEPELDDIDLVGTVLNVVPVEADEAPTS